MENSKFVQSQDEPQLREFAKMFLNIWMSNGFGALTKKDTELLIFSCLQSAIDKDRKIDNYHWAKDLKVTPAKVKSLKLEAYLKFGHLFKTDIKGLISQYFSNVKSVRFSISDETLQFKDGDVRLLVEDPVVKMEIEQKIKEMEGVPEYGRNREILILGIVDFLVLVDRILDCGESMIIEDIAEGKLEETNKINAVIKEMEDSSYRSLSNGKKLAKFLDLVGRTFFNKEMKLIDHLKLIF